MRVRRVDKTTRVEALLADVERAVGALRDELTSDSVRLPGLRAGEMAGLDSDG